jgi:hypothetical protein
MGPPAHTLLNTTPIGANPAVEVAHDCEAIFCWPEETRELSGSGERVRGRTFKIDLTVNIGGAIGKAGISAMAHALFDSFKERGIHVDTVTVGACFPARRMRKRAEYVRQFHSKPKGSW